MGFCLHRWATRRKDRFVAGLTDLFRTQNLFFNGRDEFAKLDRRGLASSLRNINQGEEDLDIETILSTTAVSAFNPARNTRNPLLRIATVVGFSFVLLIPVRAGCITDCKGEYYSEIDSCRSTYDEPDDADDLRQCVDNAKDEYDDCNGECTS